MIVTKGGNGRCLFNFFYSIAYIHYFEFWNHLLYTFHRHVSWPKDQAIKVSVRNLLMSQRSMKFVKDPHGFPWLSLDVFFPTAAALGSSSIVKKFWGKIAFCLSMFLWGRSRLGSKQFCGRSPQGCQSSSPKVFTPLEYNVLHLIV